jgi:hypothetical protein
MTNRKLQDLKNSLCRLLLISGIEFHSFYTYGVVLSEIGSDDLLNSYESDMYINPDVLFLDTKIQVTDITWFSLELF